MNFPNTSNRSSLILLLLGFFSMPVHGLEPSNPCNLFLTVGNLEKIGLRHMGGGLFSGKSTFVFRQLPDGSLKAYRPDMDRQALGVKVVSQTTRLDGFRTDPGQYDYHTVKLDTAVKNDEGKLFSSLNGSIALEPAPELLPKNIPEMDSYFKTAGFEKTADGVYETTLKTWSTYPDGSNKGEVKTESVVVLIRGTSITQILVETSPPEKFQQWLNTHNGKLVRLGRDSWWPWAAKTNIVGENDYFTFELTLNGIQQILKFKVDAALIPKALLLEPGNSNVPKSEGGSNFIVSGINSTTEIKSLSTLNGIPIAKIERNMRPLQMSDKGFLGVNEKLLDVLAADNDTVIVKYKLSHQQIADELDRIVSIGGHIKDGKAFTYNGQKLKVKYSPLLLGSQSSPFEDGIRGTSNITIKNLSNGRSIDFSPLLIPMIQRYGFYEGFQSPYRLDPEKILAVLSFLKNI